MPYKGLSWRNLRPLSVRYSLCTTDTSFVAVDEPTNVSPPLLGFPDTEVKLLCAQGGPAALAYVAEVISPCGYHSYLPLANRFLLMRGIYQQDSLVEYLTRKMIREIIA